MKKYYLPAVIVLVVLLLAGFGFKATNSLFAPVPTPSPTPPPQAVQLTPDKYPSVSISFSADSHYATIKIQNINAAKLEYNLIYTATVKKNQIQTGVNAAADLNGQTTYEKTQLLGSESSGHFTYHENIKDADIELTLRDSLGRSIFFGTYPFTVVAGASQDLKLQSQ